MNENKKLKYLFYIDTIQILIIANNLKIENFVR